MAEEKKVLLSAQDLWVKFRVRGRILTAIRGISLAFICAAINMSIGVVLGAVWGFS